MQIDSIKISLADPVLKISRAKIHLENLRGALDAFYKTPPYALIGEEDIEGQWYTIKPKIDDVPDSINLIVGDLLYCIRSSLDQTAWSLAKLSVPYPTQTQFPIFEANPIVDKNLRDRWKRYTAGMPTDAVRIIESLQPYHGPDIAARRSHLLWQLNALCNIDKHRRIPVHGEITEFHNVIPMEADPFIQRLENNAVMMPLRFKSEVDLYPQTTFKVLFGDYSESVSCDFDGIERIYKFVANDVIPRFNRFFQ